MQDDFREMRMDTEQLDLLVTKIIHEQLLMQGLILTRAILYG